MANLFVCWSRALLSSKPTNGSTEHNNMPMHNTHNERHCQQRVDETRLIYNSVSSCLSGNIDFKLLNDNRIQYTHSFSFCNRNSFSRLFLVSLMLCKHIAFASNLLPSSDSLYFFFLIFCIIYTVTSVYIPDCFWFFNIFLLFLCCFFFLSRHFLITAIPLCARFVT